MNKNAKHKPISDQMKPEGREFFKIYPITKLLFETERNGGYIKEWLELIPDNLLKKAIEASDDKDEKPEYKEIRQDIFTCGLLLNLFLKGNMFSSTSQKKVCKTADMLRVVVFQEEGFRRCGILDVFYEKPSWNLNDSSAKGNEIINDDPIAKINYLFESSLVSLKLE